MEVNKVYCGDCKDVLKTLPENSVDSICCDPPYELGFMGKSWDNTGIANNKEMWAECLRVLKPGGHLLAFSGTRTYHRMACAIEDAGFEVRDMIEWVYGSGFPKSLNIGKAVDKLQGNERNVVGKSDSKGIKSGAGNYVGDKYKCDGYDLTKGTSEWEGWGTALKPAHEPICMARKPLAEKTVAENVLKYGTGGINIDESRVGLTGSVLSDKIDVCQCDHSKSSVLLVDKKSIQREATNGTRSEFSVAENVDMNISEKGLGTPQEDTSKETTLCLDEMLVENTTTSLNTSGSGNEKTEKYQKDTKSTTSTENIPTTDLKTCSVCGKPTTLNSTKENISPEKKNLKLEESSNKSVENGRFPSNLIHDNSEEVRECFPETGKGNDKPRNRNTIGSFGMPNDTTPEYSDSGNASRFFKSIIYQAKASKSERNMGCDNYLIINICVENMEQAELPPKDILELTKKWLTELCGKDKMEKFQLDILSTTKTETNKTTTSLTLSCLPPLNIKESIADAFKTKKVNGGNPVIYAENTNELKQIITNGLMESILGAKPVLSKELLKISVNENNFHATVKPIALMEYLIKMVTPKGGIVLDPFAGSGSTLVAAKQNGFQYIGIEMTAEYIPIIEARLNAIKLTLF